MRRLAIILLVCGVPLFLSAAKDTTGENPKLHTWRISFGGISRSVDDIVFHTGTRSSAGMIPKQARSGTDDDSAVGPNGIGDHYYDNGYVLPDIATTEDGDTWYWGYNDASQVQGDRLVFSADGGTETKYWRDTSLVDEESINSDETTFGPILQFDYLFGEKRGVQFGAMFNASYISFSKDGSACTFHDDQRWDTYSRQITDVYDLMGVVPDPAPYEHGPDGPGALLPEAPSSRTITTDKARTDTLSAWNAINESFDFDLTTLSFGVSGEKRIGAFALTGAAGPTLNLINLDSTSRETLYTSRNGGPATVYATWRDDNNDQELNSGFFFQAGCAAYLFKGVRFNLLGRYDWTKDVSSSVGPTEIEMDLTGFSAMATISFDI
jgi:hypothetical protein